MSNVPLTAMIFSLTTGLEFMGRSQPKIEVKQASYVSKFIGKDMTELNKIKFSCFN